MAIAWETTPAWAQQGVSDDDATIRRGLELRRQGKDQEALEEFQSAYAQNKKTRAIAQVGLAEQALGRWPEAEAHVTQALEDVTEPWIRRNRGTLENALREIQRHLGSLEVIGPSGALVLVNEQVVGTLPLGRPVRVPIGVLNVEVRKGGFLPSTRPVSISAGVLTRESIGLQRTPASAVLQAPSARRPLADGEAVDVDAIGSSRGAVDKNLADTPESANQDNGGASWHRSLGWVAAGTSVLSIVGGGTALILRSRKIDDANGLHCNVADGTVTPSDPANLPRCLDLADSASTLGVTGVVALAAGGALAIGAILLFATAQSPAPSSASSAISAPNLACSLTVSTVGATCRLRF